MSTILGARASATTSRHRSGSAVAGRAIDGVIAVMTATTTVVTTATVPAQAADGILGAMTGATIAAGEVGLRNGEPTGALNGRLVRGAQPAPVAG